MNAPIRYPVAVQPRIAPLARLPVFFSLRGRRVVVAGGGSASAWKAELLAASGADVSVYANDPCQELLVLGRDRDNVSLIRRDWRQDDLHQAALAVGGFDTDAEAGAFAAAARAAGVPVNVIDKPDFCDFSFGAVVNRSPLVIGISTDGAAPALAQAIRTRIEALLPERMARWIAAAAQWRAAVKSSGLAFNERRRFWQMLAARSAESGAGPTESEFQRLLAQAGGAAAGQGSVQVIDVLPGQPDLLTVRDLRALQKADVLVFDDGVPFEVLDFSRREARRVNLGIPHGESLDEATLDVLSRYRDAGEHVVVLRQKRD